ncbi:MAG: hypothetical protein ACR2P0_18130 [Acidimicrobiales bacterium]
MPDATAASSSVRPKMSRIPIRWPAPL